VWFCVKITSNEFFQKKKENQALKKGKGICPRERRKK